MFVNHLNKKKPHLYAFLKYLFKIPLSMIDELSAE